MTPEEQIALWVEGDSRCPNDRGECCPDFSCCSPSLLMSKEQRIAFQDATQAEREVMLAGSLLVAVGNGGRVLIWSAHEPCARCSMLKECRDVLGDGSRICYGCAIEQEKEAYMQRLIGVQ